MRKKITAEQYAQMKETDIREAARQLKGNPFVYRCGGILVKTSFAGTRPLQSVLEECLEHSK